MSAHRDSFKNVVNGKIGFGDTVIGTIETDKRRRCNGTDGMPGAVATDGYENPNGCVKQIAAAVAAGQRGRVQTARRIVDAAADRTTGAAKTGVMVLTTPSSVVLPLRPAIIPAP